MDYPVGSRFLPNERGLVRLYLRNMVEKNESRFITTKDVYKDEPSLLDHVNNPLFKKNKWYYYVPRTKRGGVTPKRTVPGRGGSEGGFWKSNGGKSEIKDGHKGLILGYKQSLTYHTKMQGTVVKTDWLMTEYTLNKGRHTFQDLVLCCIRNTGDRVPQPPPQPQPQPPPQVVENNNMDTNNISFSNQQVQEETGLTGFANDLEMILEEDDRDVTHEQQQQEEETLIIPPTQSNNNNNLVMLSNQQVVQEEAGLTGFANELEMTLEEDDRDVTQQQQQEEETLIIPPTQSNNNNNVMMLSNQQVVQEEAGLTGFANKLETMMLEEEDRDVTQQQEEDLPLLPAMQINDDDNNNNNVMMMPDEELLDWDINNENLSISFEDLFKILDEGKENNNQQEGQS